ncbi:aspartate/glutamate racemase family protein [Sinirhodobacter huangdaonensis]|uniref:HyuE hydantoin racemase n=1 Tax=Paenirhodobacter huangdaonensis TaxID=2501515 RepID=A0A3S3M2C0_9RHOB|nr:aspartate/glutamate racemase family protein [Sinirhodobacter huangdaonensis]RWR54594.1 HyuE hydantoin racemase [Sinirhodobacter huangdaonensis]
MKLIFMNPNSTESMTRQVVEAARAAAPGAEILGWTNAGGPPAIEGPEHGRQAVAGLLAMLPAARAEGADVLVIACFDDTGLGELRAAAHCPVIGIGQAAYHMAALVAGRFSVVTTLAVSVPVLEDNLGRYGLATGCVSVRPSGLPVLAVEKGGAVVIARLAEEIRLARAEGAGAIALGCAGMCGLRGALAELTDLPVIDGVAAAANLGQAIARTVGAGAGDAA